MKTKIPLTLTLWTFLFFTVTNVLAQYTKNLYTGGNIKSEGLLVEGKKEGLWIFYYPDKAIMAKENYLHDTLNGLCEYYDFEGKISQKGLWSMGLEIDSSFQYFPNGLVKRKGVFKGGLYEGEWVSFNENGTLHNKGFYKKGNPEGIWNFYDSNGKLKSTAEYKEGKLEGLYIEYDQSGEKTLEGSYVNGEKRGIWQQYLKKGKVKKINYN